MNRSLSRSLPLALSVAVLVGLGATACGDRTDAADASSSAAPETSEAAPGTTSETTSETTPETAPPAPADVDAEPDVVERVDFPGPEVVFDDSGSAGSDGKSFWVTTPAEEKFSVDLPTVAEGWIANVVVDLGDAGFGYLVTQTGGEYYETHLVVLDAGRLYVAKRSDDVPFGEYVGEGDVEFTTFTTGDGAALMTRLGTGELYRWSVVDDTLVPTLVS